MAQVADTQCRQALDFARAVAFGIGEIDLVALGQSASSEIVGLGAWMRANEVSRFEAIGAMLNLREALVEVAGLDKATEPVPMRTADRGRFLWILASYLENLVDRVVVACSQAGRDPVIARKSLLAEAVALLEG